MVTKGAHTIALIWALASLFVAGGESPAREPVNFCLGCHGVGPVEFHRSSGETRVIALDMARFRRSAHAEVDCQRCHERGFAIFPHPLDITRTRTCMDCHPRDGAAAEADRAYAFQRIEAAFRETSHHTGFPKDFACETCHDPHRFRPADAGMSPRALIATQNTACQRCHAGDADKGPLAAPAKPDLPGVHAGIPHTELHLTGVRCIDCHSPPAVPVSHKLAGADGQPARCGDCHARDSILTRKLLRHQSNGEGNESGFSNTALLRHAYVVGATRHRLVDWLGYVAVGGAALGLTVHGGVSVYFRRRERRQRHER